MRGFSLPVRRDRRQRGSSMVEMALTMLVLIPILLYSFFLTDALYLKMDLQETVVSGTWDFSTRNSEKENSANSEVSAVKEAVRSVYSDHTSAFEDGAEVGVTGYGDVTRINGNHNHEKHHKIYFAAQYTFLFGGTDTQFNCSLSTSDLPPGMSTTMGSFNSKYGGGQVTCEATGYIYNYIIPQKLYKEFTNVDMSSMKLRKGDSHQFQGEGGSGPNIKAHETAGVSFNTWALVNGAKESGKKHDITKADIGERNFLGSVGNVDGPFYDRVKYMYMNQLPQTGTYTAGIVPTSAAFMGKAIQQKLEVPVAVPYGPRDVAGLPNLAGAYLVARYKPQQPGIRQKPPGFGGMMHQGFQSTPYANINNNYKSAYQNRGLHYMGCKQQERAKCN